MAWVRTAASLISFGFAIDKFFALRPPARYAMFGAHHFALAMICIGLAALVLAVFQHRRSLSQLEHNFGKQPFSIALVLAGLIAALGILGLLAVLTQE
jgi:putative membrane protein